MQFSNFQILCQVFVKFYQNYFSILDFPINFLKRSIYIPFKRNIKISFSCWTPLSVFIFYRLILLVFAQVATKIFYLLYIHVTKQFIINQKYAYKILKYNLLTKIISSYTCVLVPSHILRQQSHCYGTSQNCKRNFQTDRYLTTMIPVLCFNRVSRELT